MELPTISCNVKPSKYGPGLADFILEGPIEQPGDPTFGKLMRRDDESATEDEIDEEPQPWYGEAGETVMIELENLPKGEGRLHELPGHQFSYTEKEEWRTGSKKATPRFLITFTCEAADLRNAQLEVQAMLADIGIGHIDEHFICSGQGVLHSTDVNWGEKAKAHPDTPISPKTVSGKRPYEQAFDLHEDSDSGYDTGHDNKKSKKGSGPPKARLLGGQQYYWKLL